MQPPPPFLPTRAALSAWGFNDPNNSFTSADDCDEVLREFLLYAQAKSKGKRWHIHPEFEGRCMRNLRVEFDAHRESGVTDPNAMLSVEYFLLNGNGLFWLDLPNVSAFCSSMEEALQAMSVVVPYIPACINYYCDRRDRLALEIHLWKCINFSGFDKVREEAVRRKMKLLGFYFI
jgi:hypothetical protein